MQAHSGLYAEIGAVREITSALYFIANYSIGKHSCKYLVSCRLSLSEIPIVSQTDVARRWGALAVNKKRVKTQTPC